MEPVKRIPFPFYYLEIAKSVSMRSTCLSKHYGAVIVKDNTVVSTGYNGAPCGRINCSDLGYCIRRANPTYQRGVNYTTSCRSSHSEMNAIINASKEQMKDATLYLYGYDMIEDRIVKDADCCPICKRLIINAGIKDVVIADADHGIPCEQLDYRYRTIQVSEWVKNDDTLNGTVGY